MNTLELLVKYFDELINNHNIDELEGPLTGDDGRLLPEVGRIAAELVQYGGD